MVSLQMRDNHIHPNNTHFFNINNNNNNIYFKNVISQKMNKYSNY